MKKTSGDAREGAAGTAALVGLCTATLVGFGLAWRQKARAAESARMLALHQERQARHALRAKRLEHDLRSPIGAMAVALELLRTAEDSATRCEALQVLERQVARMTSLTEQVHDFAQDLND